ncbi:hypothetical protein DSO57_1001102 [Entomophthora muscae]|uniref:Uncharacterized protein n=1 Tax=Entomophthora muscae TaxID=34485 RepID=A0ACC2SB85_9FUNG|nr:hypothetical protein DSO57_1001102 [Entomophthora muscae]
MVHCGTLIKRLHSAMRELKSQLAKVRLGIQEEGCHCKQAQLSASCVPHDGFGESTTLRQLTSSAYKDNTISSFLGRKSLPPMFVVPPTPEETLRPNCSDSSAGASQQNFFARAQKDTSPPPRRQYTEESTPRFKPMNLPKFDPKGNIHTFIRLFGNVNVWSQQSGQSNCQNSRLDLPTRFRVSRFVTCNPIIQSLEAILGSQLKFPNPTT